MDGCPQPGLEVNTAFFRFPVSAGDRCPALASLGAVSLPQSWCFSLPDSKGGPGPVSSALGGLQLTGQRREGEAHRVKADSICICSTSLGTPGSRCSFCTVPTQERLLQPAPRATRSPHAPVPVKQGLCNLGPLQGEHWKGWKIVAKSSLHCRKLPIQSSAGSNPPSLRARSRLPALREIIIRFH